ncbi:hypothetical protein [Gilvimarinus xylanilyticus]|uniref:Uncharacterized protein n=1 Tax=Gilvimarinus xylanilyticus TaxID=2944139 RepID=A0A9X2KV66_9GAMM|nr:hypothetical protein [Gilvimarinus xylanilyticus]MCP8900613.1 hypothetical protein [Gilvimarinus xylanilyticus]
MPLLLKLGSSAAGFGLPPAGGQALFSLKATVVSTELAWLELEVLLSGDELTGLELMALLLDTELAASSEAVDEVLVAD